MHHSVTAQITCPHCGHHFEANTALTSQTDIKPERKAMTKEEQKAKILQLRKIIEKEIQELDPFHFPVLLKMASNPSRKARLIDMVLRMSLKVQSPIGSILALLESDLG